MSLNAHTDAPRVRRRRTKFNTGRVRLFNNLLIQTHRVNQGGGGGSSSVQLPDLHINDSKNQNSVEL
jgi:hypothetical protein